MTMTRPTILLTRTSCALALALLASSAHGQTDVYSGYVATRVTRTVSVTSLLTSAQTFDMPTTADVHRVQAALAYTTHYPPEELGNVTVEIRPTDGSGVPTESVLASATRAAIELIPAEEIEPGDFVNFDLGVPVQLQAGVRYAVVVRSDFVDRGPTGNFAVFWRGTFNQFEDSFVDGECFLKNERPGASGVFEAEDLNFGCDQWFRVVGFLPELCGPAPEPDGSCRLADSSGLGRSRVVIRNKADDTRDKVTWVWNRGESTPVTAFHDPIGGNASYRVCLYDALGKLFELNLPNASSPSSLCEGASCWKTLFSGYRYKNKGAIPDGMFLAKLKPGDAGRSKVRIVVKGSVGTFGSPATDTLVPPVVAQMLIDDGAGTECFKTTFDSLVRQTEVIYKATGP